MADKTDSPVTVGKLREMIADSTIQIAALQAQIDILAKENQRLTDQLNKGDINGRTITVELTDNGTPITDTTGITCALAYNTTPGSGLDDRVSMPALFGTPTAPHLAESDIDWALDIINR